jgi:spore germination cell wall hydrolase CwlJ-like protein
LRIFRFKRQNRPHLSDSSSGIGRMKFPFLRNRILSRNAGILGLTCVIFAGSYTPVSFQDIQSLASQDDRWLVRLRENPGRSTVSASIGMLDTFTTGTIPAKQNRVIKAQGVSLLTSQLSEVNLPTKINRKLKGDRVVLSTIMRPPAHFSAGSVLLRLGFFSPLNIDKKQSLAFVKPKSSIEAFKVASLFHLKDAKQNHELAKLPVLVASLVRESEGSILSFAKKDSVRYSPFAAVLRDEGPISIIPKLNKYDHSWADDPLPKVSFSTKQQKCLTNGVYFESRGEPVRGQAAVAQVILNRVRNPNYPDSICGVVYQNKHRRNRCQFSFACDRFKDRVRNKSLWQMAEHVAKETTAGRIWLSQVGSSTHYHATYVRPKWAKSMKKVGKIGLHIFYRTKGGGWS